MYSYLASKISSKYICYLHVTSPFLKDNTLKTAINYFFKKKRNKNYTLASVTKIKEYLWYKNKALNYNPSNHPRSQTLPDFLALNFAINIVEKKYMETKGRIVGEKYYPVILEYPENIDIDDMWQFELGQVLVKKINIKKIKGFQLNKILITGGSGFIASHVADELSKIGKMVYILTKRSQNI